MDVMCNDNRFELIEKYKKELIESTNIESSPEEMAVLDDVLFRFWQMGWLDRLEGEVTSEKVAEYCVRRNLALVDYGFFKRVFDTYYELEIQKGEEQ